jgi:hypothetical protein
LQIDNGTMSMARATRRSGLAFLLIGLLGGLFFWLTDPRFGPGVHQHPRGHVDWQYWLFILRGSPDNVIDAANQALMSTAVGIAGCAALLLVGLWLLTRRAV